MSIWDKLNYKKKRLNKEYENLQFWEKECQNIQKNIQEAIVESENHEKLWYELNKKGIEDLTIREHRKRWKKILEDLYSQLEIATFYRDQSLEKIIKLGGVKAKVKSNKKK